MRLSLILLMLILLPVATGVHAWLFLENDLPSLQQEAVRRLQAAGVRTPEVNIRFLDLSVRGEAEDPAALQRALVAVRNLGPLRVQPGAAQLYATARLRGVLEGETLHISGWLPEEADPAEVRRLVAELRPDLTLDTNDLRTAREVTWPEGFKPPLTEESPLLKPLLERLRVPAEIHVSAQTDAIVVSGLLPDSGLKEEVVAALTEVAGARVVDPAKLKASSHVLPAKFAKTEALAAFLRSFFQAPAPRSCDIDEQGIPHLKGLATRQQESEWLKLLRPMTGGAKVDADLTLAPSELHMPGYQARSQLPPEVLQSVREALRETGAITFDVGAARLGPEEQTKLAALTPVLLAAGPALSLVIGAHPDAASPAAVEKSLGKARAEAVLSFLVEQGVPSADISAVVFDAVAAGSPFAPAVHRAVEILIK